MFTRIDHVGIAVRNLEKSVAWYQTMFGLTVVADEINDQQGVHEAMLIVQDTPAGGSHIQLLEPTREDSPIGKFLARQGEGIHHIAYGVEDVDAAIAAVDSTGVRMIDREPRHGTANSRIAFLHPKDAGGVLIELVEAAPKD